MFKFLEHKKNDTWVDNILVIVIRLTITGFIVMLGFFLAFIATMGPPIAPHIWNGGLDGGIRIGTIVIGLGSCAAILLWFFWTLCFDIYRLIIRTPLPDSDTETK